MVYSLSKDETVALVEENASGGVDAVTKLIIGTAWDQSTQQKGGLMGKFNQKKGVDLDLVAVAMNGTEPVRYAGMDQRDPLQNGTLVSTGDNQTGKGDGDDEQIIVDLAGIQAPVDGVVFIAGALKRGTDFSKASNIEFNVYDASTGSQKKIASYWPSLLGSGNAIAIASVKKDPEGFWTMTVLNEMGSVAQGEFQAVLRFAQQKFQA